MPSTVAVNFGLSASRCKCAHATSAPCQPIIQSSDERQCGQLKRPLFFHGKFVVDVLDAVQGLRNLGSVVFLRSASHRSAE